MNDNNIVAADTLASAYEDTGKQKKSEKVKAKRLAKLAKLEQKTLTLAARKIEQDKRAPKSALAEATVAVQSAFVNPTPKGEKKVLSNEFPTHYNPEAVEASWYDYWEKHGFFRPALIDGKPRREGVFTIPIPPPSVTGALHLGHALTNSIQDTLARWHRMQGKTTLFVPGCDHAGIATQIVVEKRLMKERGLTRHDLGREAFVKEVFDWKDQYAERIYGQLRRVGSSMDWDRVRFTMDPDMIESVNEAFVRLHDEGVIYRANRLVNWDTKLKTALSNLEVEQLELTGRTLLTIPDHDQQKQYEFGVIISFAYPIEHSSEEIVVATTRLETMLGDTAISVHPTDKRYLHLHGKFAIHPFQNRRIPIIPDDLCDPEFGTGAVKITPAHDANDYALGKRKNLEFINIFTDDGRINEPGGAPFIGMLRFDARVAVQEELTKKGLYRGTTDHKMSLPLSERTGNVVEQLLKPQWWVDCKEMAVTALDAVKSGKLEIVPQPSEREWYRWMESIQDWCISRQLWWGVRIPAYFVVIRNQDNDRSDAKYWVTGRNEVEALDKALNAFPTVNHVDISLEQDEDVLDTWFSAGLWPFAIMGWPKKTEDMDMFCPNSLLETGKDILFFWVARMVMLGQKLTGEIPFKKVFCHAMVRDAHGRKMSKSLGNVIDPLDVISGVTLSELHKRLESGNLDPREVVKAQEGQTKDFPNGIPQCGTDAMRFALLSYTSGGSDINLDVLRVEGYRKWCNKLWNATRFALLKLGNNYTPRDNLELTGTESLADKWILARLNHSIRKVNENLECFNFKQATSALYSFWLYDLCDVYLEAIKPIIDGNDTAAQESAKDVLYTCLEAGLKLLHPFMPFVTEELYQRLPRRAGDKVPSIMLCTYPVSRIDWDNAQSAIDWGHIDQIIKTARSLLKGYAVRDATINVVVTTPKLATLVASQSEIVKCMVKGRRTVRVLSAINAMPIECASAKVSEDITVFII
ncbi:hypothetical protein HDU89_008154 [Geranomyces variabilis]|nr:hypothetical protein HDU89_008154 [Geranomyces variabilis]